MAAYEDQVINHAPIVHEIERKVGKYGPLGHASTYNPKITPECTLPQRKKRTTRKIRNRRAP